MPAAFMIAPDRMKSGIASQRKARGAVEERDGGGEQRVAWPTSWPPAPRCRGPRRSARRSRPGPCRGRGRGAVHGASRHPVAARRQAAQRLVDPLGQGQKLGQDEKGGADGDHGLGQGHGHPGSRRTSVSPSRTTMTLIAVPGDEPEKAENKSLAEQKEGEARGGRQRGDEAGEAQMAALEGREAGAVIGDPGEADRGDLVGPGDGRVEARRSRLPAPAPRGRPSVLRR